MLAYTGSVFNACYQLSDLDEDVNQGRYTGYSLLMNPHASWARVGLGLSDL